jgi:hypothetical protein
MRVFGSLLKRRKRKIGIGHQYIEINLMLHKINYEPSQINLMTGIFAAKQTTDLSQQQKWLGDVSERCKQE